MTDHGPAVHRPASNNWEPHVCVVPCAADGCGVNWVDGRHEPKDSSAYLYSSNYAGHGQVHTGPIETWLDQAEQQARDDIPPRFDNHHVHYGIDRLLGVLRQSIHQIGRQP